MGVEPLKEACELAFAVARHGRESVPAVEAPAPMRSFLWVAQLPPRAITVAQRVIESDEQFRLRVAAYATEAQVGRHGYLWLTRPPGWEAEYGNAAGGPDVRSLRTAPHATAQLPQPAVAAAPAMPIPPRPASPTPAPAPAPAPAPMPSPAPAAVTASAAAPRTTPERPAATQGAIGDELASLRNLVDRLGEERQDVAVSNTEGRVEEPSARTVPPTDTSGRELSAARSERDRARADHAAAARRVEELEHEISSFDHERALVKDSLTSAERTTTAAVADREAAESERDRALDELAELKADRATLEARLHEAEQAKLEVERELSELSTQWSTIRAEMDEIAEQRLKVEAELDRLSQERVDTNQGNAALIGRLSAQLGQIAAERDTLAARLETARIRMSDTRSSLAEASQNISQQLDAAEAAFSEMTEAAGNLTTEVAQANATRADLDALISVADARPPALSDPVAIETVEYDVFAEPVNEPFAPVDEPEQATPELTLPEIPPMPSIPTAAELPPMPAAPVVNEIPPMPARPVLDNDVTEFGGFDTAPVATDPVTRAQIELSPDARLDAALAAREVVQTIDVVVLVDGDAVAEMGWPTLSLADRRGAIVEYLEGLAASTGAAAHVVFERQLGADESKPESKAIRVELTLPGMSASSSMAMRIDDYPVEWPVTVVSDDAVLASEAASRGVSQLGNGQLLDLFIGQ